MNLILAFAALLACVIWVVLGLGYIGPGLPVSDHAFGNMQTFLMTGVKLNLVLMAFNLLPIPPLDGSRILASFSPQYDRLISTEQGAMISMLAFFAVFFFFASELFYMANTTAWYMFDSILRIVAPGAI